MLSGICKWDHQRPFDAFNFWSRQRTIEHIIMLVVWQLLWNITEALEKYRSTAHEMRLCSGKGMGSFSCPPSNITICTQHHMHGPIFSTSHRHTVHASQCQRSGRIDVDKFPSFYMTGGRVPEEAWHFGCDWWTTRRLVSTLYVCTGVCRNAP